jgi:phosphopantothenoylcysteine decarboxylase / phosphopantothenate---cysteine ligase
MKGKKILIGITGSIAAYKIPMLVRLLVKAGAEVKIIMTPAACEFVSPLVLSTLSKNEVAIQLTSDTNWANHVMLGRWANLMLVAPASCNTIAKMANGICDNLLLSVYLSATCAVMIAPAMDEDMWHHASLVNNLAKLESYGNIILNAEHGELASGLIGFGRMVETEQLFKEIESYFTKTQRLKGQKALVTAGPTYENLDPVRYIGNYSSGKMGIAIAEQLANEGCEVKLVLGPSSLEVINPMIEVIRIKSAAQMFDASIERFNEMNIAVMSAAVADYTPMQVSDSKIKKKEDKFFIELTKTKDILKHLGSIKTKNQLLIGFALENVNEREYALKKLEVKNADAIVMNSLNDAGAGFANDTNKITIFDKNGNEQSYDLKSKHDVAVDIVNKIIELQAWKN